MDVSAETTIELPVIFEPDSIYLANIKALWEQNARLAQAIDMVDDTALIPCQKTRNGDLTCQVTGAKGEPVFLHSRYDPHREAQRWADGAIKLGEKQEEEENGRLPMCYVVDGFGLGYHIRTLMERLTGEAFIIVSEPSLAMIRTAMEHIDYSEMLKSGRILFINRPNREEIFEKLQQHSTKMMLGVVFTHTLQQRDTAFHSQVHKTIAEYASFMRSHLVSLISNSYTTCRNIAWNLPTYVGTSSIHVLKNRFKGHPAVVVSAGPSLGKNIKFLKKYRDQVVVIAVQTTLKPLLKQGIRPDFVTSLDYHEISKRFFEGLEDLEDIHLVAEPKGTWHVIDYYRERGPVSLLYNTHARAMLRQMKDDHDSLEAGATVAHLAFYLGQYIGADPVIFIGQDLGYSDNVYYSPGNALHEVWQNELNRFSTIEMKEWERIVRNRSVLRKVEDIHGNPIYTDEQMFTYLQQFEKDFSESPVRVIDATEGGVRKQNSEIMRFEEALEQFCMGEIDKEKFAYRQRINRFETSQIKPARKQVQKKLEEVEEVRAISEDIVGYLKEMQDLVDEQEKLNQKMVHLDELRTKIKYRDETCHLISFVAQGAEMYRFKADRSLELDAIEGKDKQRRQIKRDIGYVSEFIKGCDRMIDILIEADKRLEECEA